MRILIFVSLYVDILFMQDKLYLCLSLNIASRSYSYIWRDYYAYVESVPRKNTCAIIFMQHYFRFNYPLLHHYLYIIKNYVSSSQKSFFTFTRLLFHFRPSYLCISFPYNEVCHTILPLGNVRTHDVNVLVTNLFTTLLYLFMYTGLSITSLFTKRNSVFNSRFALIFLAKYIFQKHNMYLFSFDKEVISITSYTWQNE